MNETRKQIIELIEPYMDKSLIEGCLIEFPDWIRQVSYVEEIWVKYFWKDWEIYWVEHRHFGIIWHYDITAVLKYICSLWYDFEGDFRLVAFEDDIKINTIDDYGIPSGEYIPNKPLHLYTEAEEKELLELLLKLK